ncbi:MAG: SAM-dependent methyltransferase [Phycisphaerales bacterium]|nr:SAM-dependent methyltransferase [Phycisphaerales bacterium]
MSEPHDYVSRAGAKLAHALDAFALDPTGLDCADFGCNVGGFTDCLLQRKAASVIALDTGYGVLDWKLRNDTRVDVAERTNVLHAPVPETGVDLIVADVGWTPQAKVLPIALKWLRPGGRIVTLVKPHYEHSARQRGRRQATGPLDDAAARQELELVIEAVPSLGGHVLNTTDSPLRGAKSSRGKGGGNMEFLLLIEVAQAAD